ncbi:hypothetical protein ACFL3V_00700 [Nanoarchaeota archaeon]
MQAEIVSNVNGLRTGQLMDLLVKADKRLNFLKPGKQVTLIERNQGYLDEIMHKVTSSLCPRYLVVLSDYSQPHHLLGGSNVRTYHNLDDSGIVKINARVKGTDSAAEKTARKIAQYDRVSESHDRNKLMVGDILGLEVVVKGPPDAPEYVAEAVKQFLVMPFLRLEKFEQHRKSGGYTSTHLNMVYSNGNPYMRGLELEVQVTDLQSQQDSKTKPGQRHSEDYGFGSKLRCAHALPGQLVFFGNSVDLKSMNVREAEGLLVAKVPGKVVDYTLVVPKRH